MKTHKDLDVWKSSMSLVEEVYNITREYPQEEKFSLINQIRRASVSVPSNIAEGAARNSTKEFIQFLYIALGSLSELETQLLLSQRLGYLSDKKEIFANVEQIRRMLLGLIKFLKGKPS
ncbi:MAG: four helix bundle protein [bacterium]|nr:four helix bundle protein [bacterium]